MNKSNSLIFLLIFLSLGVLVSSCTTDDNEPPTESEKEVVKPSNPMVGKTIRRVGYDENTSDWFKIYNDCSIKFVSHNEYVWKIYQRVEEYDGGLEGKWNIYVYQDRTTEGTYTYSPTKIVLYPSDGGTITLTRTSVGWGDYK